LLCNQNPPAKLVLRSAIGYKVLQSSDHQDLVSIAIKVEPTFAVGEDGVGLANGSNNEDIPSECEIASQALQVIHSQVDADALLADNQDLMQQMIDTSSQLLKSARYEISGYNDWARKMPIGLKTLS
jgi:hypothetical protein